MSTLHPKIEAQKDRLQSLCNSLEFGECTPLEFRNKLVVFVAECDEEVLQWLASKLF